MSTDLEKKIRDKLSEIINPVTNQTVVNDISHIVVSKGTIAFAIFGERKDFEVLDKLKSECIARVKEVAGVEEVKISITSRVEHKKVATDKRSPIPGVRKIILVSSGKGGVGKSTVASNLAITLNKLGKKVGLVDADIYGPSIPTIFGTSQKPVIENDKMTPIKKFGVKIMSIGFLVKDEEALVWRGPMTTKMLYQLIRLSNWDYDGEQLDYLIVDTPPGTGDVHLSLAENYKIDGVVIVTLPQLLSIKDASKSIVMYQKIGVPILGVVENMGGIFGNSSVNVIEQKFGIKLLGRIPFIQDIAISSDIGTPITFSEENEDIVDVYKSLAQKLIS
jgi:ATP-binding protein involved in chromosome partitioning